MNLLPGTWQGETVSIAGRPLRVAQGTATPRQVMLGVRPGDLQVVEPGTDRRRSAVQGIAAIVERVEDLGDSAIVSFHADAGEGASQAGRAADTANGAGEPRLVKLKSDRQPNVAEGQRVHLGFAPAAAHLFDARTGARL